MRVRSTQPAHNNGMNAEPPISRFQNGASIAAARLCQTLEHIQPTKNLTRGERQIQIRKHRHNPISSHEINTSPSLNEETIKQEPEFASGLGQNCYR